LVSSQSMSECCGVGHIDVASSVLDLSHIGVVVLHNRLYKNSDIVRWRPIQVTYGHENFGHDHD
jgi:hypothetical protein